MKLSIDGDLRIAAEQLKGLYDEYIRVGFDREQAMQFLLAILKGVKS